MGTIWDDAVGGFKAFIEEQQKQGNPKFSLTTFDTLYDKVYDQVDLSKVSPDLDKNRVFPRGSTALLDAVGSTINDINAKKVMVVIFTDGLENSSHEYTKAQVKSLVEKKQKDGWGFLFLAADQDAFAEGSAFGMQRGTTHSFDSSIAGSSRVSMDTASHSTSGYLYQNKKVDVDPVQKVEKKQKVTTPK
jgi:hypothetical protein